MLVPTSNWKRQTSKAVCIMGRMHTVEAEEMIFSHLPSKTMGCFSGRLMSAASDQKLFCKLCSPFCCSFDEFVEEKVISPSYSSTILTPRKSEMMFIRWTRQGKAVWRKGTSGQIPNSFKYHTMKSELYHMMCNAESVKVRDWQYPMCFKELWRQGKVKMKVAQLCQTLRSHGLLAKILEWVAFPFSMGSSQPRDWTQVSHIADRFFASWAIREDQEYWSG